MTLTRIRLIAVMTALATVALPAQAFAGFSLGCDTNYEGFFSTCVTCGLLTAISSSIVNVANATYPALIADANSILAMGMAIYLIYYFYLWVSPITAHDSTKKAAELQHAIVRTVAVSGFLTFGNVGFGMIYSTLFTYPALIAMKPAITVIYDSLSRFPSLQPIVGKTCSSFIDIPGAMNCIIHINEAAMGWTLQVPLEGLKSINILTPTFWASGYLIFNLTGPIINAPGQFLRQIFFSAISVAFLPIVLVLWAIPFTSRAGRALMGTAIQTGFVIFFGALVVTAVSTGVLVMISTAMASLDQSSVTGSLKAASSDPINQILFAMRCGQLSLAPWEPTFWILSLMAKTYSDLLQEVHTAATYWRQEILGGASN